jgi:hypothetical protein
MIKKQKGIKIFLALSIFFFFQVFSTYLPYNHDLEIELPSSKPKFENSNQDYLLDNQQNNVEISGPNAFNLIMETPLSGKLFPFVQISSLNYITIILRC